jgi:hypothetical protein
MTRHAVGVVELGAVLLLAATVRFLALHHPHFYDELYHLLAAKSLVERGTLGIADGEPYTRARGYTYLVAEMFRLAGVGMSQMRMVSLVAGTAAVGVLFAWLRRATNRTSAWIAAALLALDPESVAYSTAGRFYILQMLLLLIAVVAVWWGTLPDRTASRRAAALVGALLALVGAIHLQVASAVGALMLVVWTLVALSAPAWRSATPSRRRAWVIVGAVTIVGAIAIAWTAGVVGWMARMTTYVPAWAAADRHEPRFYYWALVLDYPVLVALLPVLVLLALGRWLREASLCAVVFAGVIGYHSLAAFKGTRFVLYVRPLLFAACAMGFAVLLPLVRQMLRDLAGRVVRQPALARPLAGAMLVAAIGFAMFSSPGIGRTRRSIMHSAADPWEASSAELRQLASESDVVLTASRLPVLYYVGRLDGVLERPNASDPDRELDGWDAQVGKPIVASVGALEQTIAHHPTGLVIADSIHWREPWAVRDSLADFMEQHLQRVPLASSLIVYRWAQSNAPVTTAGPTR